MYKEKFGEHGCDEITFEYNENGLRTKKTRIYYDDATGNIGYKATSYTLHGKNIVHLEHKGNNLHFWYDASGKPAIVQFNGTKYAYLHNLQGDIVGIVDSAGNEVVKYIYDPWGKILSTSGPLASTLGTIQPFRYRGYVYDEETGLYYLRSRYFYPNLGRFINSDAYIGGNYGCFAHNIFAYCLNNIISHLDSNGMSSRFAGEDFCKGDSMVHVLQKPATEKMSLDDFFLLFCDMLGWKYAHGGCSYGEIDCVGVYRFPMYWYYSHNAYKKLGANGTTVEYLYENGVHNKNIGDTIKKKGKITESTTLVPGMGLFLWGEKNGKEKFLHVAIYVGDLFEGYSNAVIESVEAGVIIRELETSEAINGKFTHCGYFIGLEY